MLVLAMESHMITWTWKSRKPLQRLPPCPWVSQKSALCFQVFQQREPWHCGLILLKMMLSLLPLLHLTSCGTLAGPSQPRCCALFSSPKSVNAQLVALTIAPPGGQGEIQAFLTFSFSPWAMKLILPAIAWRDAAGIN